MSAKAIFDRLNIDDLALVQGVTEIDVVFDLLEWTEADKVSNLLCNADTSG